MSPHVHYRTALSALFKYMGRDELVATLAKSDEEAVEVLRARVHVDWELSPQSRVTLTRMINQARRELRASEEAQDD